ncbi:MAG: cysteine--tRNA ligase [Bacteroidota bacterium]
MLDHLRIYNSLTKKKEKFEPLNPPFVGMYACGPTVYSNVHIGNLRTFLTFDIVLRYLKHLGYKVRYVRNITDVGHLENDEDDGEDKIAKKAKLENLEPMEIVQRYKNDFHEVLSQLNFLPPSIEPMATGHIVEQINMVKSLLEAGYAYESNGSIYFDVLKYNEKYDYGKLSGRVLEELMDSGRELDGQDEKRNKVDFALWKKASDSHIMRWNSPWGEGFPGWHLECSVMSTKYLGETFDIHGGGMDLKFPHHECEIAQCKGSTGEEQAKYWMHSNMLTVNGQKMSKSLGNVFLPDQLFSGNHELLDRSYSPMVVRFFLLQSHYSSTLDISKDALNAASKGYRKLLNGLKLVEEMQFNDAPEAEINEKAQDQVSKLCDNCTSAMNDDFNTALTIGHLFNLLKKINSIHIGQIKTSELGEALFNRMKETYSKFIVEVLGLKQEVPQGGESFLEIILGIYREAKKNKDYDKVDELRGALKKEGIIVKDLKDSVEWAYEEN